jgi:hypothetical protein
MRVIWGNMGIGLGMNRVWEGLTQPDAHMRGHVNSGCDGFEIPARRLTAI